MMLRAADVVLAFLPALYASLQSVKSAFRTIHSTVYNIKALENEFSAEQQILSQPILYLLKMKCQNVTLIPVGNLIRGETR